ncbi:MAG: flagellar basal body P-ring formation chaperone FlgA [Bdellovibrionales bacterium]
MKTAIQPLLILAFYLMATAAEARQISIIIREVSRVNGPTLFLGDVAEINGMSEMQKKQLSSVPLGDAPAYGESRQFSNSSIAEALRSGMRGVGLSAETSEKAPLKLQIPATITIIGKGQSITEIEVKEKLVSGISETCSGCDVEIMELRVPTMDELSPKGRWEIRADYSRLRGTFQIAVEIFEPHQNKKVYWLSGRVSVKKLVPVISHNLQPGIRIQPNDFIMGKRDVTFALDASPDEKEIVGLVLKVPVRANQVLLKSQVKRQPALNRGQNVVLTSGHEVWSVSMKGVAQDEGYIGDLVKVQNPETKKIVVGVVVAEGVVEVK